jgi:hypothetical protein
MHILSKYQLPLLIHADADEEKILECIDEGLNIFGSSVKNVIYWRFRTIYNSEREDIIRKPELFRECLRTFFGERAFNVEASIVASICTNLRLSTVQMSDSVTRAINEARRTLH